MRQEAPMRSPTVGWCSAALLAALAQAQPAHAQDAPATHLHELQQQVREQAARLDALKRSLAQQEATLDALRRALDAEALAGQRGGGPAAGDTTQAQAQPRPQAQPQPQPPSQPPQAGQPQGPVGQAPEASQRPPKIAPIFDQPGVLTPRGSYVFEPSLQYSYSSSNRVALVGYTIIPAILIGVVDVREVKRNSFTGTLTWRYGVNNRFEVEARLPYVYRSDTAVGRELGQGQAINTAFDASGHGIGDIEFSARYQLNDGGADKPYYIGSLRFKTRTGRDPFEVRTSSGVVGLRDPLQTELPTGSGFYGLQPALTVLYPSDPAVFFGTVSYLHSFKRSGVMRQTDSGEESLGTISPGGVIGFNFGMGLALNERSSFSIGYDHSSVGKIKQDGRVAGDSVRLQLGTLLLGYSYRLNAKRTLNVSLGAGLTRDTPDVTLTVRMPISN